MKKISFETFCLSKKIKLSALRRDILSILFNKHEPMGAYDILEILKKKRDNAEPTTVYRVLKWLVEEKLAHRIESRNAYVCCSQFDVQEKSHQTILLFCRACNKSYEFEDNAIFRAMKKLIEKHQIEIDDTLIEMQGLCHKCLRR